jgi:hypothetical protein
VSARPDGVPEDAQAWECGNCWAWAVQDAVVVHITKDCPTHALQIVKRGINNSGGSLMDPVAGKLFELGLTTDPQQSNLRLALFDAAKRWSFDGSLPHEDKLDDLDRT